MSQAAFVKVRGKNDEKKLVFYTLATCAMCAKARSFLEDRGYTYSYLYVDELPDKEKTLLKSELSEKHAMRFAFPALVINDTQVILGFFPKAWVAALEEK